MKRPSIGMIAVAIILLIPFVGWFYYDVWKDKPHQPRLQEYYRVPFYKFCNQMGDTVSSDDLKGYIYVADFFFSTCPGVCPKLTKRMSEIQNNYKSIPQVKFVSFTVDPMHDSVSVLRKYAEKYHADSLKWYFFTGIKDSIYHLAENGFKVPVVEEQNGEEQFTHTDRMVLVDGSGMIRGYYHVVEDSMSLDTLYNNIENLLIEKPKEAGK